MADREEVAGFDDQNLLTTALTFERIWLSLNPVGTTLVWGIGGEWGGCSQSQKFDLGVPDWLGWLGLVVR